MVPPLVREMILEQKVKSLKQFFVGHGTIQIKQGGTGGEDESAPGPPDKLSAPAVSLQSCRYQKFPCRASVSQPSVEGGQF